MAIADAVHGVRVTLDRLHAADAAGDVDEVLAVFGSDGYLGLEGVRDCHEQLFAAGAFDGREISFADAELYLFGATALVRPVAY